MRMRAHHCIPLLFVASVCLGERVARAGVDTSVAAYPPDGWQNLCSGHAIDVKPTLTSRLYTGTGSCWINVAQNKSDGNTQAWVRAPVSFEGSYVMQSSTYRERLTFSIPFPTGTSSILVTTGSTCSDDPWATASQCAASQPNVNLPGSFGWAMQVPNGPLSRNVFGPGLVSALLKKQQSSPPLAPVDVDAVRWPAFDGAGSIGRVFWRAPDVSGNKWILGYDVEYANSPDSAFINGGHVTGPGAKTTLSPSEVSHYFYTTFKLSGADYYFRVCAANDAGRQCTMPVKAREATKAELMALSHHQASNAVLHAAGGPPPPAMAPPPARVRMVEPVPSPR